MAKRPDKDYDKQTARAGDRKRSVARYARAMIILQTEVNYTRLGRRIREMRLEKEIKQQDIIYGQKKPISSVWASSYIY